MIRGRLVEASTLAAGAAVHREMTTWTTMSRWSLALGGAGDGGLGGVGVGCGRARRRWRPTQSAGCLDEGLADGGRVH